jgi:hypothetical protein
VKVEGAVSISMTKWLVIAKEGNRAECILPQSEEEEVPIKIVKIR